MFKTEKLEFKVATSDQRLSKILAGDADHFGQWCRVGVTRGLCLC